MRTRPNIKIKQKTNNLINRVHPAEDGDRAIRMKLSSILLNKTARHSKRRPKTVFL